MKPRTQSRRAGALVAATVLIVTLSGMGALLMELTIARFQEQERRRDDSALLISAESAFNQAYAYFQKAPSDNLPKWSDPSHTKSWDDTNKTVLPVSGNLGHRTVVSIEILGDTDTTKWGDESYRLIATATSGDKTTNPGKYRRWRVEGIIRPNPTQVFTQGMYSIGGFSFQGSPTTDSYDSSTSPWAPPPGQDYFSDHGDLASRGTVTVQKPSSVHGKVYSNKNIALPPVSYTVPAGATDVSVAAGITNYTFTGPGTYHTSKLNGGKLRIEGGGTVTLYVDGSVDLSGTVEFDSTTSRLIVIQKDTIGDGGGLKLKSDVGQIVPTAGGLSIGRSRPQQLMWITNYDGSFTLNGNSSISAVIYAPYASFKTNGTFDFFGSIVASSFGGEVDGAGKVNGNFYFHYDESLSGIDLGLEPRLLVAGWLAMPLAFDET